MATGEPDGTWGCLNDEEVTLLTHARLISAALPRDFTGSIHLEAHYAQGVLVNINVVRKKSWRPTRRITAGKKETR